MSADSTPTTARTVADARDRERAALERECAAQHAILDALIEIVGDPTITRADARAAAAMLEPMIASAGRGEGNVDAVYAVIAAARAPLAVHAAGGIGLTTRGAGE